MHEHAFSLRILSYYYYYHTIPFFFSPIGSTLHSFYSLLFYLAFSFPFPIHNKVRNVILTLQMHAKLKHKYLYTILCKTFITIHMP